MTNSEILKRIKTDTGLRTKLVKESFYWFFLVYFTHYLKYPLAPFQKEVINLVQDETNPLLVVVAFRGSAKSTIITLAYIIWVIVSRKKRYPLIISLNQQRSYQSLFNIRQEFEKNSLLYSDFGPFYKMSDEWSYSSLYFSYYGARITAISPAEGFRGLREREVRPDIIVADDIEDVSTASTPDARAKLWRVINSELIPAGDIKTKLIFIGNLVHEDSALMRLKKLIKTGNLDGIYKEYPLYDEDKNILWKEKFNSWNDITKLKKSIPSEEDFLREYLLKIVPPGNKVIHSNWIKYYDGVLPNDKYLYEVGTGVDLAISLSASSDFTAMVSGKGYRLEDDEPRIYILTNPINKRLNFPDTIAYIKQLNNVLGGRSSNEFYIENIAYQQALVQALEKEGIAVKGVKVVNDKRSRLAMVSHWMRDGKILFPEHGCEELIQQILEFGVYNHDDLVDSFTLLVSQLMEKLTEPLVQIDFI